MAKKTNPTMLRAIIGDEAADKMGNYTESTGGGTPLKAGEKLKDHPEAKRVQQPRDEEGRFTYNSVNFKPRKYKYHGEGDSVVPFLRGANMSNLIKKNTQINYNGLIYLAGMQISAEEILETFRTYSEKDGFGKKLNTQLKGKRGRRSNITKQKIAEGKQGVLDDRTLPYLKNKKQEEYLKDLQYAWKKAKNSNKKYNKKNVKKKNTDPDNLNKPKNTDNKPSKLDSNSAKNNPTEFVKNNQDVIKDIQKDFPDVSVTEIVDIIATGEFETVDEIKKALGE